MTAYVDIPNTDIDQDSPLTQPLMTALRDNPIAIAEAAAGAPVNRTGWHDWTGTPGLTPIYDHAIDGTVAVIETPDFEDGYSYLLLIDGLSHDAGFARDLLFSLYAELDAVWGASAILFPAANGAAIYRGFAEIRLPRRIANACLTPFSVTTNNAVSHETAGLNVARDLRNSQARLRARLTLSAGASFDAGRAYLLRQVEYASR